MGISYFPPFSLCSFSPILLKVVKEITTLKTMLSKIMKQLALPLAILSLCTYLPISPPPPSQCHAKLTHSTQ